MCLLSQRMDLAFSTLQTQELTNVWAHLIFFLKFSIFDICIQIFTHNKAKIWNISLFHFQWNWWTVQLIKIFPVFKMKSYLSFLPVMLQFFLKKDAAKTCFYSKIAAPAKTVLTCLLTGWCTWWLLFNSYHNKRGWENYSRRKGLWFGFKINFLLYWDCFV